MPRRGRPRVNGERDRRIFADVNELVRSKGLSLRSAYAKTAESGDFGAMSPRTVESAYRKERKRRRLAPERIAAASNAQILAAAAERVERNRRFLAAAAAPNAQFLAAVAERKAQFLAAVAERVERNRRFLAAAAAPNAQFLAAVRRHSPLFRHLRFIQAPPLNC